MVNLLEEEKLPTLSKGLVNIYMYIYIYIYIYNIYISDNHFKQVLHYLSEGVTRGGMFILTSNWFFKPEDKPGLGWLHFTWHYYI